MQRALPPKRRRVDVGSLSPTPVHFIDLTLDSPVTTTIAAATTTTTTAQSRRRINNNSSVKAPSLTAANRGAPSRGTETIEIGDTPEPVRSRTSRKSNNNKNLNKPVADAPKNIKDENAKKNHEERIPAVNDSFDGLMPTVLVCPICYEDLRSSRKPMTTKCGHLFCESCIQTTLSSRKKCPVCMAVITIKSCIRVHF